MKSKGFPLLCVALGLLLGMFRRITAAASRLFTADGADGSFYGLESLNAHVRSMVPTHPALVLLWCQILLLVSHTDYDWWAEVQQTPRYACPPAAPLPRSRWDWGLAGCHGLCEGSACFHLSVGHRCREAWSDPRLSEPGAHATAGGCVRPAGHSCRPPPLLGSPQIGSRAGMWQRPDAVRGALLLLWH